MGSFLAKDEKTISSTSVCLTLDLDAQKISNIVDLLEQEGVAFDIGSYRDAPPGLRIWCGATIERHDVELLMEWVRWAYRIVNE